MNFEVEKADFVEEEIIKHILIDRFVYINY